MTSLVHYSCTLGGRLVLRDIDFTPHAGALVAICGPNGAGKSTLLRALAGLLPGGRPQPREVAYLPQGARSAWGLTIREVVTLGRIAQGDTNMAVVGEALAACGIAELADRRIDQVSGGQARRAMLARVLATEAQTLLLDEPVADLDPAACHVVMGLLRGLARQGSAVVAVLHALELAAHYADRLLVVQAGRIVADGVPAETLPAAAAAFGMELQQNALPLLRLRAEQKRG